MSARRAGRRLWKDHRGSTAVELALCMPVFVLLLLGVWEFGWSQHCISSTRYALKVASRTLLVNPTLDEANMRTIVQSTLETTADPNVVVALSVNEDANGRLALLTGEYSRTIALPFLPEIPIRHRESVTTVLPAV